jgi:hypothetical protein
MDRNDIEEIILGLADIVQENRYLRAENKRLMLKVACVGIVQGKEDAELAKELVDYL